MNDELLRRYATNVTAGIGDRAIVAAFTRVPRELFVRRLLEPDGTFATPTPERVYVDDALVTRLRDGLPSSSSSQPSLMARMLAELDLRPGLRVLEIGVGTGYNAALIATITGGPVVSVDVQAEVVDEAREALARSGVDRVKVVLGDGFRGAPEFGPYDRIIATVGIGGVPAAWLDQLAPGGLILGPMEHGGFQPCVAAVPTVDGPLVGRGVMASGFMLAAGPLHPNAEAPAPLDVAEPPPLIRVPEVDPRRYQDLWFWLAAQDPRVARRPVPGYDGDGVRCVFADPAGGVVLVQLDALRPIGAAPELIQRAVELVDGWHAAGRPPVRAWRCGFDFSAGLWTPAHWRLAATPAG